MTEASQQLTAINHQLHGQAFFLLIRIAPG
jgi:hypothetical protein